MKLIALLLAILTAASLRAEEVCKPEPVADPLVSVRAKQIRFPGGRLITIVGQYHGKRQVYNLGTDSADKIKLMSDSQFEKMVRDVLVDNSTALSSALWNNGVNEFVKKLDVSSKELSNFMKDVNAPKGTVIEGAREDESYLLSRLNRDSDRPALIGLEAHDPQVIPAMKQAFDFFKEQFSLRKGLTLSQQEIHDFMLSGVMGNVHPYMVSPQLFQVAPLTPMEGEEALNDESAANVPGVDRNAFVDVISENKRYLQSVSDAQRNKIHPQLIAYANAFGKILAASMARFPQEGPDELADQLAKATPPWLTKTGAKVVKAFRILGEYTTARDYRVAQNLAYSKKTRTNLSQFAKSKTRTNRFRTPMFPSILPTISHRPHQLCSNFCTNYWHGLSIRSKA